MMKYGCYDVDVDGSGINVSDRRSINESTRTSELVAASGWRVRARVDSVVVQGLF